MLRKRIRRLRFALKWYSLTALTPLRAKRKIQISEIILTTSALVLNEILIAASQHRDGNARFIIVIADHLGMDGDDSKIEAIRVIYNLIKKIKSEIDRLPLEEKFKNEARKFINPFNGLESLSQVHLSIQDSKRHFLTAENLVGLTRLHMTLSGHFREPDVGAEIKELADEFRALRDEALQCELPRHVKRAIIKRVTQIAAILDNFHAFGTEDLQDELEALVGTMVASPQQATASNSTWYKRAAAAVAGGFLFLKGVDASLVSVLAILDNGEKLLSIANEMLEETEKG